MNTNKLQSEIRPIVEQQEIDKLLNIEIINRKAIEAVEQDGNIVQLFQLPTVIAFRNCFYR